MSVIVVLDHPQDLVNIAHVVRAMKNFGVRDLRLVNPVAFDPYRIEGIAHQTQDVLSRVQVFDDLGAALADCVHVTGFTARGRTAKRNVQRPHEAATEVRERTGEGPVALLFGREDRGLSNDALDRCQRIVTIPSDPSYPSLNLAHAVVVMLYELAVARGAAEQPFKTPRRRADAARSEDLERLFADMQRALEQIDFFKTRSSEAVMRTMRELIHRTPIDGRELKLLRAIAIEIVKHDERTARSRIHLDR
jgi:tRNA/rRNA methyltransferase/tRNA (cytidine32/uridine32-2'-O)-methyltransferase